jgi:hypothetical protein
MNIKKLYNYFTFTWLLAFTINPVKVSAVKLSQGRNMLIAAYYNNPRMLKFAFSSGMDNNGLVFPIGSSNIQIRGNIGDRSTREEINNNGFYHKILFPGQVAYPLSYNINLETGHPCEKILNAWMAGPDSGIITPELVTDVIFSIMCDDRVTNGFNAKMEKIRSYLKGKNPNILAALNKTVGDFNYMLNGSLNNKSVNDINGNALWPKFTEFFYILLWRMANVPKSNEPITDFRMLQAMHICEFWSKPENLAVCEIWDAICFLISKICVKDIIDLGQTYGVPLIEYVNNKFTWICNCVHLILQGNPPTEKDNLMIKMRRCAKQWANCCYVFFQRYNSLSKNEKIAALPNFQLLNGIHRLFDARQINGIVSQLVKGAPINAQQLNFISGFINDPTRIAILNKLPDILSSLNTNRNGLDQLSQQQLESSINVIRVIGKAMICYGLGFTSSFKQLNIVSQSKGSPLETTLSNKIDDRKNMGWLPRNLAFAQDNLNSKKLVMEHNKPNVSTLLNVKAPMTNKIKPSSVIATQSTLPGISTNFASTLPIPLTLSFAPTVPLASQPSSANQDRFSSNRSGNFTKNSRSINSRRNRNSRGRTSRRRSRSRSRSRSRRGNRRPRRSSGE